MEAIFVYTLILTKTPVFRAASGLELFGGGLLLMPVFGLRGCVSYDNLRERHWGYDIAADLEREHSWPKFCYRAYDVWL